MSEDLDRLQKLIDSVNDGMLSQPPVQAAVRQVFAILPAMMEALRAAEFQINLTSQSSVFLSDRMEALTSAIREHVK